MAQPYLWQTNSGRDDVHVIDLSRGTVVDRVVVGPEPHEIAAPENEATVPVSLEANDRERGEIVWIDPERRVVTQRVEVGPDPTKSRSRPMAGGSMCPAATDTTGSSTPRRRRW